MREFVPKRGRQPTGFRRITPDMLPVDRLAEQFKQLPPAVKSPAQILAAFKAAAPGLGISGRIVNAIDWLFRFTKPHDWEPGSRPVVWPSADTQQSEWGRSKSQVKATNRRLVELGLVTMKDSPNGKRYGRRDPQTGKIIEAYGFDLSPMALRYDDFVAASELWRLRKAELARLRRRRTIARNRVVQLTDTAAEHAIIDSAWIESVTALAEHGAAVNQAGNDIEALPPALEAFEQRLREARTLLQSLLDQIKNHPMGPENRPHQYTYNRALYPESDTVIASKPSSSIRNTENTPVASQNEPDPPQRQSPPPSEPDRPLKIGPAELLDLAPRLSDYVPAPRPDWTDIVDGAEILRRDLGVSRSLWIEACQTMGRQAAAVALAVLSTKPKDHFITTPGGYFFGMVAKAKAGTLNLDRTLWALRHERRRE